MAPRIEEQPSRRIQLDSDHEPLATAVVAGSRANSPGLAAFDFTVDDSDSNTVLDSVVVFWRRAMMPRMYDQLNIEEGGHSTARLGTLSSKLDESGAFHPKTTFIPKPLSSQTTFIPNPKT